MSLDLIFKPESFKRWGGVVSPAMAGTLVAIPAGDRSTILRRQAAAVLYVVSCPALVLVAALPC